MLYDSISEILLFICIIVLLGPIVIFCGFFKESQLFLCTFYPKYFMHVALTETVDCSSIISSKWMLMYIKAVKFYINLFSFYFFLDLY